jgi:glycosyltransferase involved in cell wall biosynthesis
VTFNDYTVALSKKYPEWAPLPSYEKKWLELEKGLFENARFIFTVSLNTRNSLIIDYGIEPQKIVQVPYGPTIEDKLDDVIMRDRNSILFVGKDFKRKGGVILLKAFEKVKKEIKDARLIIVGPRKDDLKINQPGVKVIGYLHDKKEVNDLFKRASVFVLPSFCEPFGLVFLEAMAYQLPCIGTTVDAIPEIIEDEKTGFLVSPGDIDTLAEKIIILLRDSELSQKMGKAGNQRLHQKFQWNYLGEKIDNVLKQCL